MPFDPDAFLETTASIAPPKPFDPDGFLSATAPAPADFAPDAFLAFSEAVPAAPRSWPQQRADELRRGLHSAGQMVNSIALRGAADTQRTQEALAADPNRDLDPTERWLVDKLTPGGLAARGAAARRMAEQRAAQAQAAKMRAAADFTEHQKAIEAIPTSAAMADFQRSEGFAGKLGAVLRNPVAVPADITLNSAPAMVPGIVAGSVLGTEFGPVGTAVGAFMGSLAPEYQGKIIEVMADEGVDLKNPDSVAAFMADPQRLAHAQQLALRKGLPIAVVDAISGGFAGKILGKAMGKGFGKVAAASVAEGATQAAAGGLGEAAGELAAGEALDAGNILSEMVGEGPSAIQETATNLRHDRAIRRAATEGEARPQKDGGANEALQRSIAADNARRGVPVPPPADIDAVLGQMQAEEQRQRETAAAAEAERARRAAEVAARRETLLGHLERAEQLSGAESPTFAEVQGALATLEQYEGDNSLRLDPEQRARLEQVGLQLTRRREELRGAEEARRAQAQAEAKAAADAADAQRTASAKAEQARLREIERTGRDESGRIVSLSRLPVEELQRIDELQDFEAEGITAAQVETELRRRMQAEERRAATADEAGNDLLAALRQVKLPNRDSALGVELEQLIGEGMTVAERKRYVNFHRSGGLDSVAEQLRADHGFTQIQTPADVIDHVQRALRGEQVLPERKVDFAAARRATPYTEGITRAQLDAPVQVVPAPADPQWTADNRANNQRLRTMLDPLAGSVVNGIEITRAGLKHVARLLNGPEEFRMAAQLQQLLETSVPIGPEVATERADTKIQRRLAVAEIDGQVMPVRFTVREQAGRRTLYHLENAERPHSISQRYTAERQSAWIGEGVRLTVADLLRNVKPQQDDTYAADFAAGRPAQARLSEARKDGIWRRLQAMLPELTKQVEIKIALTRRAYREALNREIGPGQGRGSEAVAIPAQLRQDLEAAEAERNAIIFAAEAWTSDRKGVKRLLHEAAHIFFWTLPRETRKALKSEYARQLAAAKALQEHFDGGTQLDAEALARAQREVGPLWDAQGRVNSDLDGVEDGTDHGLREWFAELTMWRNRQWALRRYVQAGTLSGRLRMMIDDAADALRELTRQVARAFVQSRGQDFAADFWEQSFRDFLANGAQWGSKQESAAVSYARAEFARPDFATPREMPEKPVRNLTPEQAAAEGIGPGADPLVAVRRRIADLERQRERMSAEGGSIAAYNHISEEIRDLQEQRRRLERSSAASVETQPADTAGEGGQAKTDAADSLAADTEASPFNAAEPSPEQATEDAQREASQRRKRVQALEGQSAVAPAWYTRTWDKVLEILRGFKGAIPEIPTFPRAFWNRSDPFLKDTPEFYNDLKQGYRSIQRMDAVVRREAEDRLASIVRPLLAAAKAADKRHDPAQYQRLLELQARATHKENRGEAVPAALLQEIEALQSRIENDPYVLFSRLAMYLDLRWRAQNLKTDQGQPITLPMGLTLADVETRLAEVRERIAASGQGSAIAQALKAHTELVAQVAQDLETRELFPQETLRNPYYFPHLVLNQTSHDKTTGKVIQRERDLRLERVAVDTGEAFRGYLLDPVGSDRPIETDYTKAMFYHLVQVGAHNAMADARDQWFKPYDIRNEVAARAKQLSRQRGQTVSWRQAFDEEFKDRGYVLMSADLGRNLMPAVTIDRDRLAQRLGAAIGEGELQSELAKLGVKGVQILPDDVRECLMAGEKEYWVVPARVADALQGIKRRAEAQDNAIEKTMGMAVGMWKRWMLFAPHNWMRYEFNNRVADLEKLFSADPAAFRYLPRAFREVRAYFDGRDQAKITPEVRAAARHGVVGGITAEELGKLPELNQLEGLATDRQRFFAWIKNHNNIAFSRLDESAFRYAKYLADLERIRAGARPVYAGAYHRDIDHILEGQRPEVQALQREIDALRATIEERNQRSKTETGAARDAMVQANAKAGSRLAEAEQRLAQLPDSRPELAAAEISNKTFGDYGDISVNGAWMRKKLAPFWSWTEVNFKYHANLFRNMRDAVAAGDQSAAEAAKAGGRAAAVFAFTLTRKGAGLFLTRLALPYIAVAMWNSGDDDRRKIEEELSEEDRRRFHIIVGRTADGRPEVIYFPTAFSDVMKWFGGPDAARLGMEWLNGHTTLDTAIGDWTQRLLPDALNNIVGQIGPAFKLPYVAIAKKNTFPDVTDQRTIPAYDYWRAVISAATDQFTASMIWRAINEDFVDPRTMGDWASQLILQVRRRDPESWAFYAVKDKAEKFVQQHTGRNRDPGAYDAPEAQVLRQFRRAIYQADMPTAVRMYDRLLAYGYTADRFKASIRSQHPLAGVPTELRDDFVRSLTPYERGMLDRALRYYTRMGGMRDSASRLFPRAGKTPRQNEIYQRLFTPRPERLAEEILDRAQMPDDEIEQEAERQLRSSLR